MKKETERKRERERERERENAASCHVFVPSKGPKYFEMDLARERSELY